MSDLAGVARYVLDVAATGIDGWDIEFLLPEGPLASELRNLGCPTTTGAFGREIGITRSLATLRRTIGRTSPDLIHSHLAWGDVISGWGRPADLPLISTEHGVAEVPNLYNRTRAMAAAKRTLHRYRMRGTDCLIPVSHATASAAHQLWGPPRGVTRVIHNGVDRMDRDAAAPVAGPRFGCFARLAPEKDYPTMLRAFGLLHERLPEATLAIAGVGPLEGWLRREVERMGLASAASLRGFMAPDDFFREVDNVVQLSVWENCSYSVLDAVVRGKGVIATEVGGYLEYLPSRCLAPVGDASRAAERMFEQAGDISARPDLPSDWPTVHQMTERIGRVYAEVLGGRTARGGHCRRYGRRGEREDSWPPAAVSSRSAPAPPRTAARRALWVVSVSDMAGVARHVLDAADAGVEGWELSFLLPEGRLADELRARGAVVETDGFGKEHGTLASIRALRRVSSRDSPQIIHSHLAWADIVAAMARPSGIRLLSTEHGIAPGKLYHQRFVRRAVTRAVHRARVRRTDAIIAVSRATAAVAEDTWGYPRVGSFEVIHNGVDGLPTAEQASQPGARFGCLARLAKEKDFGTLLAAFQRLLERLPAATLDIAGTGPLEPSLRAEIHRRGLASTVRLRGFMEPEDFFREVDVVVQLSLWENCSYSVLDAIVHGKGVVATAVGGYLEYLPGWCVVPVGDDAAAAKRMLEQSTELPSRPRLPADWPSVGDMTRQIARVYGEVTAPRARPSWTLRGSQPEIGSRSS